MEEALIKLRFDKGEIMHGKMIDDTFQIPDLGCRIEVANGWYCAHQVANAARR